MSNEIAVYVVDDSPPVCHSIQWLFKSVKMPVVVYNDPLDFLKEYDSSHQGCLLLDVRMPVMNGFEVLKELKKRKNRMPIIMLTGHGDVQMAVRAMKEGVADFILKPFDDEELLEKVQKAVAADKNRQPTVKESPYKQCIQSMTPRELEVMTLIAEGKLSKQIAGILNISTSTVDFHRANLMKKIKVKTLAELIKVYLHHTSFSD